MPEYRITIDSKSHGPKLPGQRPSKLEVLKATIIGLLGLALAIGFLLAAFVLGSIIASVLLVLFAVVVVLGVARYIIRKLKRLF